MPTKSAGRVNFRHVIIVAVAACCIVKMFSSTRSAFRAGEMLRRGREITATTKWAYASGA